MLDLARQQGRDLSKLSEQESVVLSHFQRAIGAVQTEHHFLSGLNYMYMLGPMIVRINHGSQL
ncbi:MAG TPA: hypothetical protein VGF59_24905, partial [Bryobacteraceae bacterium]